MLYYSTNDKGLKADFKEATINGQAPDKGLYFPAHIPLLPGSFIKEIERFSKIEIALQVIQPFTGDAIPYSILENIVTETLSFEFPLVPVGTNIYALELFHGPTLAFKDVGARFMSRCLSYFVQSLGEKVTILVATSGDTGGAVADGFYDVEGVDVVILYPSGKVSAVQELQVTTLGKNITALEIKGSFDDCQQLVKQAFGDKEVTQKRFLTSANSINVARWLPQQFYYFFAYQQWKNKDWPPVFSVPSGNFGNLCAGLLAHQTGLPANHFIAACNANDPVTQFLQSGNYEAKKAVSTLSNAMDVGNPSNFIRILELFNHEFSSLKNVLSSCSITDELTKETLKEIYAKEHYLLDPHGAVAYRALQQYLQQHTREKGIFLETAHPVKFYDIIKPIVEVPIPLPATIDHLFLKKKQSTIMEASYQLFKDFLLG